MRSVVISALLILTGCYTPICNLDGLLGPKYSHNAVHHATIQTVHQFYLTPRAAKACSSIPCVLSWPSTPLAAGVNFWADLLSFLAGNGVGRKCIMARESLWSNGPEDILHEYIHQLDDLTRDGDADFIDLEEFKQAHNRMSKDPQWFGLWLFAEKYSDYWATNWFGIGELSEQIAFVGARMAVQQNGPDYMWDVFKNILRKN